MLCGVLRVGIFFLGRVKWKGRIFNVYLGHIVLYGMAWTGYDIGCRVVARLEFNATWRRRTGVSESKAKD